MNTIVSNNFPFAYRPFFTSPFTLRLYSLSLPIYGYGMGLLLPLLLSWDGKNLIIGQKWVGRQDPRKLQDTSIEKRKQFHGGRGFYIDSDPFYTAGSEAPDADA